MPLTKSLLALTYAFPASIIPLHSFTSCGDKQIKEWNADFHNTGLILMLAGSQLSLRTLRTRPLYGLRNLFFGVWFERFNSLNVLHLHWYLKGETRLTVGFSYATRFGEAWSRRGFTWWSVRFDQCLRAANFSQFDITCSATTLTTLRGLFPGGNLRTCLVCGNIKQWVHSQVGSTCHPEESLSYTCIHTLSICYNVHFVWMISAMKHVFFFHVKRFIAVLFFTLCSDARL